MHIIRTAGLGCLLALLFALPAHAQELHQDHQGVWRAEVIEILDDRTVTVPGTDVENRVQQLKVEILGDGRGGEIVEFENDYIPLEQGDVFFLDYFETIEGITFYSVREIDRRSAMGLVFAIFVATILVFGGWQGLRSLLSLAGSLFVIAYILVPQLVAGVSPIPLGVGVAAMVLFFAIFFTHGFNLRSLIAYAGTIITVALTGAFAFFAVSHTGLTGFASDESVYLNLNTGGQLDFVGLLLAAIIIGALGVLDDIAVTQVAVVRELFETKGIDKWEVYNRAMRVGKEHVGALVNTLVLAYTGAALPLLLLFSLSESSIFSIINREIFATEIIRTLVGSTGLILTVPITTLLAVLIIHKYGEKIPLGDGHGHSHGHAH